MSLATRIANQLPCLRRYARALTGSQMSGDAYVRATLEAALTDQDLRERISEGRVELYSAFTRIWNAAGNSEPRPEHDGVDHEIIAQVRLAHITPAHRQALLLTTLEDFTTEETGRILDLTRENVEQLVAQALSEIADENRTTVLIIEDEPLIAMQLESLMEELGHTVIGTAATRKHAVDIFSETPAGLILADIQLADGSSGIDAVEDVLNFADVPVIFITAYPERLLTGERPEPTYLVTKPFRETTVRAAISQALFFGTKGALS